MSPHDDHPWNIKTVINNLRLVREGSFNTRNACMFGTQVLALKPELPLPELAKESSTPWKLNMENLQDFCNKSTTIYCPYNHVDQHMPFTNMYQYICREWSHSNIHKTDIEFARFFAKLVAVSKKNPTTEEIIALHKALCNAFQEAHTRGYPKEDNRWGVGEPDFLGYDHRHNKWGVRDNHFIANHQVEFYNIKPLLRAIIIIIDERLPDGPGIYNFPEQRVRLVLTGTTAGLIAPITFEGLILLKKINENEVVTTLPEAIRFIMELDRAQEALQEKRDATILDDWLGDPKRHIQMYYSKPENREKHPERFWTGDDKDIPVGPSTSWYTEGLMDDRGKPLKRGRSRSIKD